MATPHKPPAEPHKPPAEVPPAIMPSPATDYKPIKETPQVAAAEGADVPRVVKGIDRAPAGHQRYKIRADNTASASTPLYILAKAGDVEGAKKCYEAHCPEHWKEHEKQLRAWERAGKPGLPPDPPELIVTELPD